MPGAVIDAASNLWCVSLRNGGGRWARPRFRLGQRRLGAATGLDDLVEDQLAAFDLVQAVVGQRRVSVLVDVVRAEHRLAALRAEELVDDRLARDLAATGIGRTLDRVEDDRHRLVAIDGVRSRRLVTRLLHVLVEELL